MELSRARRQQPGRHHGLIACDLDGTLLRTDGSLSRRTVASIRAAEAAGWAFLVVTARPARRVSDISRAAGLTGTALCSNGAVVIDLESGAFLRGYPIEPDVAGELITGLRHAIDGVVFAFELGLRYGREEAYPRFANLDDQVRDEHVADALELASRPVHKLIVAHPALQFDSLLSGVRSAIGERAHVTHSAREFVEVSAVGVDKGSGVRRVADDLGIGAADVIAIGDMPNDVPMLRWAGHAVAVANAHPHAISVADRIVGSNDDDGVADLLDSLASRPA